MAHTWNAHLKKPSGMNNLEMPCGITPAEACFVHGKVWDDQFRRAC